MAEDPINQQAFDEDVAAAAAAGGDQGFAIPEGAGGAGDFKMPSPEDIWEIVKGMEGISDAERAELRESIFNPKPPGADDLMKQYGQAGHSANEYVVFIVMIVLILLVFGLFGFKLYKSLTAKELKKQEKLKSKQQKKAKKSN